MKYPPFFLFRSLENIVRSLIDLPAFLVSTIPPCVPTEDGNGGGACCHFPFVYNGKSYSDCIDNTIHNGEPIQQHGNQPVQRAWCGTNGSGEKWGYCLKGLRFVSHIIYLRFFGILFVGIFWDFVGLFKVRWGFHGIPLVMDYLFDWITQYLMGERK